MSIVKCDHCHLEFDENVMIKESLASPTTIRYFCCNGCQGVYHILQNDGLDSFYDKLGNNTISPPLKSNTSLEKFDLATFQQRYIKTTDDDFKSINLIIEGIHCAACVWLNEKILYNLDGIIDVKINFTNFKAKIIWNDEKLKLSQIISKIQSIGYNAYPYDKTISEEKSLKNNRSYFIKMMVAVFSSVNIMMLDIAKYSGFFSGINQDILHLIHIAEFIFTTPVLFFSGSIFFKGAFYGLKNKIVNMDLLVSAGATLTYIYSIYILFGGYGYSYFDSVTMIITFVLIGKYLEVLGKKSATDTLDKIKSQLPTEATIIQNGVKKSISPEEIKVNDIIEIKAGEKVSVDGIIISGTSTFDESNISGESIPVVKTIDNTIISGTINLDSVVRIRVSKDYKHSTMNNIINIIEDSLQSKSDIENKANELSKYFSITILAISSLSFLSWYIYNGDFENALLICISVIVIACPCALALATPIASLIGISSLAKRGLLFKEAKHIETFAKATTLILDKTGTITHGNLKVIDQSNRIDTKYLDVLYNLLDSSNHPVSCSIKSYLKNKYKAEFKLIQLHNIKQIPAIGISAKYYDIDIFGGKLDDKQEYESTMYHFVVNGENIVTFKLQDEIRKEAYNVISYFKNKNIKVIMLTGDNQKVAAKVAAKVGIKDFKANMNPVQKAQYCSRLQRNKEVVIMVGDGVNDTPALAKADISIAIGNGADIVICVSDIIVLNTNLESLKTSLIISKQTYKFIKQNLSISLLYNIITIPLAIFGYVIPLIAALSMSLSSLLVVGNSMRIKR
ncbi:Lead, cadmium, zinc and mercury transporting ATPase; Copper-translocating P-type ATPase [hydrothermal vent metagenome]|uniref:Lead, cadmium, zinc and mercury transporting ATPase Copper-translocating P-type ATPase n=1 Tax=hydrothermal vent metagenome TaxID=652676 RepID=A0A3B1DWK1_9ZZZZ